MKIVIVNMLRLVILLFVWSCPDVSADDWYYHYMVSVRTDKENRCGTDNDVDINVVSPTGDTGYQKANFKNQNDFERGNVGNYEVWGNKAMQPNKICLWKKCSFSWLSDDWCPSYVRVYNRDNMQVIGWAYFGKMDSCQQTCKYLQKAPSKPSEPTSKPVSNSLFMADIGHSWEYRTLLNSVWPVGKNAGQGAFSLFNAMRHFMKSQGDNSADALVIAGDVGYVAGDYKGNADMMDMYRTYSDERIPRDRVFPAIGNHDVHYLGCVFPYASKTCYYGVTSAAAVSTKSISYDTWVGNWLASYVGLKGVILPPRNNPAFLPQIKSWQAPTRYNFYLSEESSVYGIVGLVVGAAMNGWGPTHPDHAKPSADTSIGSDAECAFLQDSLAHGRSLGFTVFVYYTHNLENLKCTQLVNQIDAWIYGHAHSIGQSVPSHAVVKQEERKVPVKLLIGNGGFDEGASDVVSFGHMKEYIVGDRVQVFFNIYDTCISSENCPSGVSPNAHCWNSCYDFNDGDFGRMATPSKYGYGWVIDAPMRRSSRSEAMQQLPADENSSNAMTSTSETAPVQMNESDILAMDSPPDQVIDMMGEDHEMESWTDDTKFRMFGKNIPIGCLVWQMVADVATELQDEAFDVKLCKQACEAQPGCSVWSFRLDQPQGSPACYIQTTNATASYIFQDGWLSGPPHCHEVARSCTTLPGSNFPGSDSEESMSAWPMGYQPQALQCWPRKKSTGDLYPCMKSTKILADVSHGWPGTCKNMTPADLPADKDCMEACWDDPACPAWILTEAEECFHGVGDQCYDATGPTPLKGQRLMHGTYRVLKDLTGLQVEGLYNVFNSVDVDNIEASNAKPVDVCRDVCLSHPFCQVWQLLSDYGCFIELNSASADHLGPNGELNSASYSVGYPLTQDQFGPNGDVVVAGQFIQRYCPDYFEAGHKPQDDGMVVGLQLNNFDEVHPLERKKLEAMDPGHVQATHYDSVALFALVVGFSAVISFGVMRVRRTLKSRTEYEPLQPVLLHGEMQ